MESLQNIKRRLKSVHNINQITKAMELVAATKMRRSQEIALASRPYAFAALDLLGKLSNVEQLAISPLLEKREVKHRAIVLITSDKGLAGSFNSSVIRAFEKYMAQTNADFPRTVAEKLPHKSAFDPHGSAAMNYSFIAVGQKAAAHLERNFKLSQKFVRAGDYTTPEEVRPIAEHLVAGFLSREWDEVIVFSTHFKSALQQFVVARKIFPVDITAIKDTLQEIVPETGRFSEFRRSSNLQPLTSNIQHPDYLMEPSPNEILKTLIPHLVMMQIYHLVLEANASEHAARRVAMKNASDNASELAENLTVVYNKSRQASITRELIEITAGAEALG